MNKRSEKLNRVVSLAKAEERRSGAQMGQSQSTLNEQRERLGALNSHRHDYAGKAAEVRQIDSARWKDYQSFLSRLDQAVTRQQQIVKDCERNLELHRRHWVAKRQRLESLEHVLERCLKEESVHEDRLQQRNLDDIPLTASPYRDDME